MVYEVYEHMTTDEQVLVEDAQEYAMEKLGIKISPLGANGEYTLEQADFLLEFTEWYFSGEWIRKKVKDTEYENTYQDIIEDEIYERQLEKNLLDE